MNKQRKRHISQGKFERVQSKGIESLLVTDSGIIKPVYSLRGFIYWTDWKRGYGFKYYRKSLQEALK